MKTERNKSTYQFVLLDLDNQALQLVHEQLVAGLAVGQVLAEPSLQGFAHGDLLRLQERLQHHLRVRAKDNELRNGTVKFKYSAEHRR